MALLSSLRKLLAGSPSPSAPAGPASGMGSSFKTSGLPSVPAHGGPAATAATAAALSEGHWSAEMLGFSARLLGVAELRDRAASPQELALLHSLQQHDGAKWADALPRLPAVLPQLMSLTRRDDASPRELVHLLSRDPSLVGELMRLANSARYRRGREISDLNGAVMVLGQQGLNQLVMSVALRPIFNQRQGRYSRVAGTLPWDLSERCAQASARLANAGDDAFAAYLAGLTAQVGLMALLRALDALPTPAAAPESEAVHRQMLTLAAGWSAQIAQQWGFPPLVCAALAPQAGRSAEATVLAQLLQQAQAVALRQLQQPGLAPAQLRDWSLAQQRCYAELQAQFA